MTIRKRFISIVMILTLIITALSGCAGKTSNSDSKTLVFAISGFDTKNFNPATAMPILNKYVLQAVFESLLEIGEDGSLQPVIAESYEISDDYKTVTFNIRKDVKFQDGSALTASDVKFSIDKYLETESTNGKTLQTYVSSVDQTGDYTVVVNCKSAYPYILNTLAGVSILPKAYIDKNGEEYFNTHPVGTGVYKISSIEPDLSVTLEAVPNHWRDTPEYTTIIVKNIPDASTQLSMLKTGEADIIQVSTDQLDEVKSTPGISIKNLEKTTMTGIFVQGAWEDRGEASQNLKVRQALDYAINREEIVKSFFNGNALPEKYWKVSPNGENWDPNWKATEYNPELAKQLLKEAGYPNAFQKPVIRLYTFAGDWRSKLAELIASYWEDIGLQVEIKQQDETALMQFARGTGGLSDEAYGAVCLWSSPVGSLDGISSQVIWYRTDGTISVIRNDKSMDTLFDQAMASFEVDKRNEIDNQIMQKVDDQLKYSFGLAYVDSLWGVSDKVKTWLADYANNLGGFSASYYKTIKSK